MSRSLVLIGYLPKQFTEADGKHVRASEYAGVEEICSVSECFAKSPPGWVDKWLHNTETWLFDTPEAAWSVVPSAERERYRLYAYRLLPTLFHESGEETEHPLPELTDGPHSGWEHRSGVRRRRARPSWSVRRTSGGNGLWPAFFWPLAAVLQRHG